MKNWQEEATNFAKNHNLSHPAGVYAIDLMSELGEVAKEILRATTYGKNPNPHYDQKISGELGDVLFSLCLLATAVDVNLEDALAQALDKYEQRWQKTRQIGSGQ